MQLLTKFQLKYVSCGPSTIAELLVSFIIILSEGHCCVCNGCPLTPVSNSTASKHLWNVSEQTKFKTEISDKQ